MKLVWLARYIFGMLSLLFMGSLMVSYAPGAERFAAILQGGSLGGAIVAAIVAAWLRRLPADHWIHKSNTASVAFISAAIFTTIIALGVVG